MLINLTPTIITEVKKNNQTKLIHASYYIMTEQTHLNHSIQKKGVIISALLKNQYPVILDGTWYIKLLYFYKTPKAEKLLCVFEIRKLIHLNCPPFCHYWSSFSAFTNKKKINIFYIKHKKYDIDSIIMKTIYFNKIYQHL